MPKIEKQDYKEINSVTIEHDLKSAKTFDDLRKVATTMLADMEKRINRAFWDIDADVFDNTFDTKKPKNDFEKIASLLGSTDIPHDIQTLKSKLSDLKVTTEILEYFDDPSHDLQVFTTDIDDITPYREDIYKLLMSALFDSDYNSHLMQTELTDLSDAEVMSNLLKHSKDTVEITQSWKRKTDKIFFMGLVSSIRRNIYKNPNDVAHSEWDTNKYCYPKDFADKLAPEDRKIFEYNYTLWCGTFMGDKVVSTYKNFHNQPHSAEEEKNLGKNTADIFKKFGLIELASGFDGFIERSSPYATFKTMLESRLGGQNIFTKLKAEVQNPETLKLLHAKIMVGALSRNDYMWFLKKHLDAAPNKTEIITDFIDMIKKEPELRKKTLQGIDGVMSIFSDVFKQHLDDFIAIDQNFGVSMLYAMQQANISGIDTYITKYKNSFGAVEKNIRTIDALLAKTQIHTLSIYDNGGWAGFFQNEIASYKENKSAYELVVQKQENTIPADQNLKTQDFIGYEMYVFREKSTWSTLSFVQYDIDHMIPDLIKNAPGIADRKYDLLACRGHCYSTSEMVIGAQQNNIIDANSIVIDGWCFNFNKIGQYREQWVQSPVMSFNDTGIWSVTNYLFTQILKNKWTGKNFAQLKKDMFAGISDDLYSKASAEKKADTEDKQRSYLKNAMKMGSSPYELYLSLNKSAKTENILASNI